MQISVGACKLGGGGGGVKTAIGTFSRERCKLPFSFLTRKSCVSNAEAGVFGKAPGSGHPPERLFELCQERGAHPQFARESAAAFNLHLKKG